MTEAKHPRLKVGDLPDLCGVGPNGLRYTGFFRRWLALHFGTPHHIQTPQLQQCVWRNTAETTGIVIESHTAFDPRLTETRPAIMIKRQDWGSIRFGLNDSSPMGEISLRGERTYSLAWQGSHTLFCLSRQPAEAEMLGFEVVVAMSHFSPAVRQHYRFLRLALSQLGTVSRLKEATNTYVVPVTVAYIIEDVWTLQNETEEMRELKLALIVS